jgi:hypothetical protein
MAIPNNTQVMAGERNSCINLINGIDGGWFRKKGSMKKGKIRVCTSLELHEL